MGLPIYDNIDRILKEQHMTRRQLAIKAGMKESTMSAAFARRSTTFHPVNLKKIADVLGVTTEELLRDNAVTSDLGIKNGVPTIAATWPLGHPWHAYSEDEIKSITAEAHADFSKLKPHGKYVALLSIKQLLTEQQKPSDT